MVVFREHAEMTTEVAAGRRCLLVGAQPKSDSAYSIIAVLNVTNLSTHILRTTWQQSLCLFVSPGALQGECCDDFEVPAR